MQPQELDHHLRKLLGHRSGGRWVFIWTGILVAVAIVLTFPTFFQIFAPEE